MVWLTIDFCALLRITVQHSGYVRLIRVNEGMQSVCDGTNSREGKISECCEDENEYNWPYAVKWISTKSIGQRSSYSDSWIITDQVKKAFSVRGEPRCGDSKQELDATLLACPRVSGPCHFTISFELSHPHLVHVHVQHLLLYTAHCACAISRDPH